jgi:hypothetical protein
LELATADKREIARLVLVMVVPELRRSGRGQKYPETLVTSA